MFLVSIVESSYMYAVHNRIVRRYFRHCIVGEKIQDGRHLFKVKQ